MTKDEQIIKAALEDGGIPAAQAAAYRLLLQHADLFSAMDQVSGAKGDGYEPPQVERILREHGWGG